MNARLTARSGTVSHSRPRRRVSTARRNAMYATLPLVALATAAASVDAPDAPGRARELKVVLPARLQEEVRIVGALAELFATAAAEHLMNAGLTASSDVVVHRGDWAANVHGLRQLGLGDVAVRDGRRRAGLHRAQSLLHPRTWLPASARGGRHEADHHRPQRDEDGRWCGDAGGRGAGNQE